MRGAPLCLQSSSPVAAIALLAPFFSGIVAPIGVVVRLDFLSFTPTPVVVRLDSLSLVGVDAIALPRVTRMLKHW